METFLTFPLVLGLLFKIVAGKNLVGMSYAFYREKFNFAAELNIYVMLQNSGAEDFPRKIVRRSEVINNLLSSDELHTK